MKNKLLYKGSGLTLSDPMLLNKQTLRSDTSSLQNATIIFLKMDTLWLGKDLKLLNDLVSELGSGSGSSEVNATDLV